MTTEIVRRRSDSAPSVRVAERDTSDRPLNSLLNSCGVRDDHFTMSDDRPTRALRLRRGHRRGASALLGTAMALGLPTILALPAAARFMGEVPLPTGPTTTVAGPTNTGFVPPSSGSTPDGEAGGPAGASTPTGDPTTGSPTSGTVTSGGTATTAPAGEPGAAGASPTGDPTPGTSQTGTTLAPPSRRSAGATAADAVGPATAGPGASPTRTDAPAGADPSPTDGPETGSARADNAAADTAPTDGRVPADPGDAGTRAAAGTGRPAEELGLGSLVARGVVTAGGTGLISILLGGGFLFVQGWIDRRDPKLALAPLRPMPPLTFPPEPRTVRHVDASR